MNAYKCDICGKYFEDNRAKTGSSYSAYSEVTGHHKLKLRLMVKNDIGREMSTVKKNDEWELFTGDICPDCMGYFCVGLVERGCQSENVKMYAADYIRKAREEMGIKEETTEDGTTE